MKRLLSTTLATFALLATSACDVVTRREAPKDPKPKVPEIEDEEPGTAPMSSILSRIEAAEEHIDVGETIGVTISVKDVNGDPVKSVEGITCEVAFGDTVPTASLGTMGGVTASGGVFVTSLTGTVGGTASKIIAKINGTPLMTYEQVTVHWDPTMRAGLKVWLAADALTGVTNGQAIASWADASGEDNHATQSTGAAKPTYKTNAINGKPSVVFNGSTHFLSITDNAGLQSTVLSVFAVAKYATSAAASTIAAKTTSAAWNDGWGLGDITGTGTGFGFFVNDKSTHKVSGTIGTGSYVYFGASYDKTSIRYYVNANPVGALAYTTNINNPAAALLIGANAGGAGFFAGEVAELIVYDVGVTSNTDLLNLKNYINGRYGL